MALVNATLLLGGLLIAVPVILHLVMRQQPKKLVFPAVRFVQKRRMNNQRKLQLRHWLLLLLRCIAIACLAFALARPSVASATVGNWVTIGGLLLLACLGAAALALAVIRQRGRWLIGGLSTSVVLLLLAVSLLTFQTLRSDAGVLLGKQEAPVAAVIVIDTAPAMDYRLSNRTRLEQAQQTGRWLIEQLPPDSEVAVLGARPQPSVFAVDLAAAVKAIDRLETTPASRPLTQVVRDAVRLAEANAKQRKEIYVLTDLRQRAWPAADTQLQEGLAANPEILLYLLDVGVEDSANVALRDVQLESAALSREGELVVRTSIESQNTAGVRTVELYVEEPDEELPVVRDGEVVVPKSRQRGRKEVTLQPGDVQTIEFRVRGFEVGVHHGFVRLGGEDGLAIDNQRYFTFEVHAARPILVVAPQEVWTLPIVEWLAPSDFRTTGRARYEVVEARQADFDNQTLQDFAAVLLLDPEPLTPEAWQRLSQYVQAGGGLGIFLGHNATPASLNESTAQQLLPGNLLRQWRASDRELFLDPIGFNHPITEVFRSIQTNVPWNLFPVFRHWQLEPRDPASVIIRYGNQEPAVLETNWGAGRVLTMTTPLTDPNRPAGWQRWNDLASGENNWPPFLLLNQMVQYLIEAQTPQLNFTTGQVASLPHSEDRDPPRFQVFLPSGELQEIEGRDGAIVAKFTDRPGNYRLKGSRGHIVLKGFSTNLPAAASDLQRVERARLDAILGADRYHYAHSREEIQREQGNQRMGREFYPFLLLVLAFVLALEHVLSNRFYKAPPPATTRSAALRAPQPSSSVRAG